MQVKLVSSDVLFSVRVQVAVNGAHLLEYKHRVELERVDTISISGKVKVQAVGILSPSSVSVSVTRGNLQLYHQRVNLFVCLFQSPTSPAGSPPNKDTDESAIIDQVSFQYLCCIPLV